MSQLEFRSHLVLSLLKTECHQITHFGYSSKTSLLKEVVYYANQGHSISPGLTYTDMFHIGNSQRFSSEKIKDMPFLLPEDIANAVVYVLGTPPHVQVHELTIKPVGEEV